LAETDLIWANRGKAIQSYAILEQALCHVLATIGDMNMETAATIFYRITNTGSRNAILERLLHKKHGNRFNSFWSTCLKDLRQIDIKRNQIVHWLSAANVALNTENMMIVGVTLIHPSSVGEQKPPAHQMTSKDLIEFSERCDAYLLRLPRRSRDARASMSGTSTYSPSAIQNLVDVTDINAMEPGKSGLATMVFDCGPQQAHDASIVQHKSAAALTAGE
jgi:hypothetical protein